MEEGSQPFEQLDHINNCEDLDKKWSIFEHNCFLGEKCMDPDDNQVYLGVSYLWVSIIDPIQILDCADLNMLSGILVFFGNLF